MCKSWTSFQILSKIHFYFTHPSLKSKIPQSPIFQMEWLSPSGKEKNKWCLKENHQLWRTEKQIMEDPTNRLNKNKRKQTEIVKGVTESTLQRAKRSGGQGRLKRMKLWWIVIGAFQQTNWLQRCGGLWGLPLRLQDRGEWCIRIICLTESLWILSNLYQSFASMIWEENRFPSFKLGVSDFMPNNIMTSKCWPKLA